MTVIELAEHGAPLSVVLDDAAGRALAASGLVEAAPDPWSPGRWRVTAGGKVGVATVTVPGGGAVTVRITPKVPIARLLFLLGYSLDPKGWRTEEVPVDEEPELLHVLARLFAPQAETALRQGLIQGYRTAEETALIVRGRIREADQIRRHHGRLMPLEIVHDDYTADIAENRLLRTACERLLRLPGVPGDVRGRLLRLRARLADIMVIGTGQEPPKWRPSRLNARYHRALRLAEIVLRGASVEHRPGDVIVSGFLFDLAKVFEDFVTVALREALADSDGHCVLQATGYLDERDAIRMAPDFVWYAEDGTPLAVADAKYKAERPKGFPDADLYQMLAYCTALNLREGHLVYAKGDAPHAAHRVRHAGITLHQHALELDQPPAGLLAEVQALARRLTASVPA
ncbi:5-methylcytosine-specific restriction enzyme subunit McrC [Streptosporangium canum]|uniref:5-methylcytosine-specific restriction enzyme subunit McrC n=1 Tax=Streptosporangium canum TaxID=324952 RepID=A0A1I4ER63_9ACTN|nr:restriction endonuclease [Streptosporangium canum]SFL06651.1 5-methylcytosine-specific restriction enzyme subunit McrC [Streptosporangium canum]